MSGAFDDEGEQLARVVAVVDHQDSSRARGVARTGWRDLGIHALRRIALSRLAVNNIVERIDRNPTLRARPSYRRRTLSRWRLRVLPKRACRNHSALRRRLPRVCVLAIADAMMTIRFDALPVAAVRDLLGLVRALYSWGLPEKASGWTTFWVTAAASGALLTSA